MQKKLFSVLAVSSMLAVSVAGAAFAKEETTEEATSEESSVEVDAIEEDELPDGTGFKVGMVTDVGGVHDGSFNQSSWEGLQKAADEMNIEAQYLESKQDTDYVPNLEYFVDEDFDLIISVGYKLADATREMAELYPDKKFVIIDDSSCSDLDNVTCLMFAQSQASYLVGYVAGLTTETNNVGFVLGMASDTMHEFGYGYCAGVLDANPDCTIQQNNANSFADSSAGKTAATTMVTNGADIIFHAAGGTGIGVINGCADAKIWAIGVDSDQSSIAPETILTSAMKRVDNACFDSVKNLINDELKNGVITYDLASGGVDIAPTTDNLSDEVIKKVKEVKEQIIKGDIVVPSNKEEFEAAYGADVYTLD